MVRTSVTRSDIASCVTFLFLPHFEVICDLLLNRRTATWNLFVKFKELWNCSCDRVAFADQVGGVDLTNTFHGCRARGILNSTVRPNPLASSNVVAL